MNKPWEKESLLRKRKDGPWSPGTDLRFLDDDDWEPKMLSVTPADSLLLRPVSGDELPQLGQVSEELTTSSSVDCQSQLLEKDDTIYSQT